MCRCGLFLRRQKRLDEAQKQREEAEALMLARREELMKDKDGYWSRRMAQESASTLPLGAAGSAQAAAAAAAAAAEASQIHWMMPKSFRHFSKMLRPLLSFGFLAVMELAPSPANHCLPGPLPGHCALSMV